MNRKYIYPILVIIASVIFYYAEEYIDTNSPASVPEQQDTRHPDSFYYLPTSTTDAVITHPHYTLSYAEKHEQAEWVAYELKREQVVRNEFKRPYFDIDKKVRTTAADWQNYKKSGYDKGHLCPAADRGFSYQAFKSTFLTSNISPQEHQFNSGIWNDLERKTRYWAKKYDGLYVVTGGVLTRDLPTIGYEHVSVPKYFYKILLDMTPSTPKLIAFLIPHRDSKKPLRDFVVPVDEIEQRTGIDFFSGLDDTLETRLEASTNTHNWTF